MTTWVPAEWPEPPDDHHQWVRPEAEACPWCDCCSRRLCELALANDAAGRMDSACHLLGSSADYDLRECPCWREGSEMAVALGEHPTE